MKNKVDKLKEIFDSDQFNLLNIESSENVEVNEVDQRLIDSFQEISNFYEKHERLPGMVHIMEFKLYSRLESIKKDPSKVKVLLPYDFYNLLDSVNTRSFEPVEIIKDDPFNLLKDDDEDLSIYEMKNVPKSNRIRPDYMSRRKICKHFEDYELIFNILHSDLENRKRRLIRFDPNAIEEGNFYVLNGVVLLVEKLNLQEVSNSFSSGDRSRLDGRTICIFDNGTESDMLFRSLVKALQIDGFGISERLDNSNQTIIEESDEEHGFIYILKSRSMLESIRSIRDLYKIGYSTGDVTKRIRNAKTEPTYLMAEVDLVSSFRCYNMNTATLEGKLHALFDEVRLEIEIFDIEGKSYRPREWFEVPIEVIEEAVDLIVKDNIENFYYDSKIERIIAK
jgi:hypothetical protein